MAIRTPDISATALTVLCLALWPCSALSQASIASYEQAGFWGEEKRGATLSVPRLFVVTVNKGWKQEAQQVTVDQKKELFYRGLLPLVLVANEAIESDREHLERLAQQLGAGEAPSQAESAWLLALAKRYRVLDADASGDAGAYIDELLARVDIIPPALALGQGAYESGYATSRFTLLGNALFGQWTYGGKGMTPKAQRASKGDYKVASFDWPLDSVRGYMMNLNTQRSYAGLREERAATRSRGEPLTGLALVGGLGSYSEKGEEYVNTLAGIIRHNGLDIADGAVLRDEPSVLIVGVDTEAEAVDVRREIEAMRASGELDEIIAQMRLAK